MSKYVLYVDVTNLPKEKAKEYMRECLDIVRSSDFLDKDDKVIALPRRDGSGSTEILVLP